MNMRSNLLLIEDNASDFLLIKRHLQSNGIDAHCHQVTSSAELVSCIENKNWDAVLADYNVPGITFAQILELIHSALPDVPVILVSGTVGEEKAVELIKAGVTDFVLKDNLTRLGQAITRALQEAVALRARRAAEQLLSEKDQLLARMSALAHIGGWEYDPMTESFVGTEEVARIHEMDPSAATGMALMFNFVHQEWQRKMKAALRDAADRGMPFDLELEIVTAKGNRKWVHLVGEPVGAGAGGAKIQGSVQDITDRKQAEALRELDRAKTAFFADISHEFRAPLALMLGPLDEALNAPGCPLPDITRQRLGLAHRNARRLLKLVNSLLDFARIEKGRAQVAYQSTDLAALTSDLASMFRSTVESAGLEFIVDCPPLPEPVYVDPDMWEKIELNLLSNAFKFTFAGSIAVRVHWQDASAVLTVSDSGIGMPVEHLPRLFERFYRIPNTRCRTYDGSGIGLALARELVNLHGGTIGVDSVLDQGTTFTVTIPGGRAHLPADRIGAKSSLASTTIAAGIFVEEAERWQAAGSIIPTASDASTLTGNSATAAAQSHRPRILWADDNADMRQYVYGLLAPRWDVEAVADGMQALEAARRTPPDLVLTDIMMPNLDGIGLLRALRAEERTRETPVILLSARAGEEDRVEGLNAGANDYLDTPFDARELLARIRTHLDIAGLRWHAVAVARHDALTKLPNRALTHEFAKALLAGAVRHCRRCAVLFIDMDRFKLINDTYGHEAGDAVLIDVAQRLKACMRGEDMVGRLGGDEFVVVLPHIHEASNAAHAARHMIDMLGQPYRVGKLELHTSPSVGISMFPDNGSDIDTLIKHADIAMYHAKQLGRNNFQFYTQELNENATRALHIENSLRSGLEHGQFQLYYQPIVDTSKRTLCSAEVFLRWPVMGIGPDQFIPVAEAGGMIDQIGDWVIHEACRQSRQWQDGGLPALPLSINVSPLQFRQRSLHDAIAHALSEHRVDPGSLTLELTETALLNDADEAISILHRMKNLGLKIALDDFGKGDSSLSRLGRLPIDIIKIDQQFVHTLATDPASMVIAEAIIGIGKTLRLRVIAEGIESADMLATLRDKHCDEMQGYYLCPPVPAEAFAHWRHNWGAA